jgi:hypothetical protein
MSGVLICFNAGVLSWWDLSGDDAVFLLFGFRFADSFDEFEEVLREVGT